MLRHFGYILLFSCLSLVAFGQKTSGTGTSLGCQLHVPNAFTPNDDNINERFVVQQGESCRLLEYNMKIFDRWGRIVFETNSADPQQAWDGTTDGQRLQKGVYMYNVRAKMEPLSGSAEPEVINKQGTVVLIR